MFDALQSSRLRLRASPKTMAAVPSAMQDLEPEASRRLHRKIGLTATDIVASRFATAALMIWERLLLAATPATGGCSSAAEPGTTFE